jgi:hypothetical protein
MIMAIKEGLPLKVITAEIPAPMRGRAAAHGLFGVLEQHIQGVIQGGGKKSIFRYNFGKLLPQVLKIGR